MAETLYHYIGAARSAGANGRLGEVFNPATGEVSAHLPYASAADVDAAAQAALGAFDEWSNMSAPPARGVIFKFRELVIANRDKIADLVGQEHGKTIADALGSIQRGIDVTEFACGVPHLMKGEFSLNVGGGIDCYSFREPVGVVAGITPFNFPVMIPCGWA